MGASNGTTARATNQGSNNEPVQQNQQTPPEIPVPINRNDPLALATAAAASEVAAAVQALAAANINTPAEDALLDAGDYGIYGVVSKIFRKVCFYEL